MGLAREASVISKLATVGGQNYASTRLPTRTRSLEAMANQVKPPTPSSLLEKPRPDKTEAPTCKLFVRWRPTPRNYTNFEIGGSGGEQALNNKCIKLRI